MDYNRIVNVHLKIRDKRAEIKKVYEAEDKALLDQQERLEGELLRFLNDSGVDSSRTEAGTFFKQKDVIPTGADWAAFYAWVREHDAFDALERRIKKTFITEYMEANDDALPPGVSTFTRYKVRVRRANGKD